ncbi:hypothetical protein N8328_05070 [Crocinitomicaceae bacterium]|nr:hypothetical protein [Crocinitomicaceae bacterium]MDC1403757.1 hypothetical protein [Crocinitomicaceae bacterium]
MKKIILLTTLISLILSIGTFVSCKKKKGVYILEGTIKDGTFVQNIANQTLQVKVLKAGSASYVSYSTVTTDSDGKYHVEIERDLLDKIRIEGTKNLYFPISFTVSISDLTVGNVYTIDFTTTAKSWVNLIFHNVNGDSSTELKYIKTAGKQGCTECCPTTYQSLYGLVNDTITCINDGNGYYGYNYEIVGTNVLDTRTVQTPAFETAEIILNY